MNQTPKTPTNPERIASELAAAGWTLDYTFTDTGAHNRPSVATFTVTAPNGQKHTGTYTQGAAHRVWSKTLRSPQMDDGGPDIFSGAKVGCRVGWSLTGRLTLAAESILRKHTEPAPLTLDSVLWSLYMDSSGVRWGQSFEDWCADLGMDTDSRKAEAMFNACRDTEAFLRRAGVDFEVWDRLFEQY